MKTLNQKEFEQQNVFGLGAANDAYAQYFIGQSYLNSLTKPEDGLSTNRISPPTAVHAKPVTTPAYSLP